MDKLVIKGEITDTAGVGVTECYIKILDGQTRLIINYFNTGDKNTFVQELSSVKADSLIIQVSHIGYENAVTVAAKSALISVVATMRLKSTHLNEATVKAPPIWKRGDTTFYNTAYFKEGEERKLKDLIIKIPGFDIKDDGSLYYRNKPVDRIKIDGEELFKDKVKLLLENFPTHVVNTIQAIENQSNNKLLKGLDNNGNVTVNLGLHKNKAVVFGSAEASLSTKGKYNFNPVVFSLKGALKASYIGNWNSIGNGIGWQEESELKKGEVQEAESWMMQNHPLQTIPDFRNRWYLRNQQWDNRLQVNVPLTRKVKSETEISYIKDHQQQQSAYNSSILNGNIYFSRTDSNTIHYIPNLITIQEQLTFSIDSSRELKTTLKFYGDYNSSSQQTTFIDTARHYLNNDITDKWRSYSVNLEYVHRKTNKKASYWFFNYNNQLQDQLGQGLSPEWSSIYQLNDPQYNLLIQQPSNRYQSMIISCRQFNPFNHFPVTMGFGMSHTIADLSNTMQLKTGSILKPAIRPVLFNNSGWYSVSRLYGDLRKRVEITKDIPVMFSFSYGVAANTIDEQTSKRTIVKPEYAFSASQIYAINSKVFSMLDVSYSQSQLDISRLQGYLYPSAINAYKRYLNVNEPLRKASFNYGLRWDWPHNLSSSAVSFFITHYFSGFVTLNNLNSIVAIQTDSLITKPTGTFGISTTNTIPSLFLGALLNIEAGYTRTSGYTHTGKELYNTKISNYLMKVSVRKNWNRKYFINFAADGTLSHFNNALNNSTVSPDVVNLKLSLMQRVPVGSFNIIANTSAFNNNMFTPDKRFFLFADMQVEYQPEKKPFSFALRADNITNVRYYKSYHNSILSQSFYTVPLISRNFSFSVRYEF